MIWTIGGKAIHMKSFTWRLTTAFLLATAIAYLAGCQTISTSADVERRTTVQFVSANTLLIEARRAGLDTVYLRPLVLRRAALVASTKGYSHIRLIDARAWFAGGPSAAWHATAQVRLINADQATDDGWDYSVEPLLAYPVRPHADSMTNAATLVGSWGNPSQQDVYFWVAPIFVDMLDVASEFTAASVAGRVVTVPSGLAQIGAFIEYAVREMGGLRMLSSSSRRNSNQAMDTESLVQ